MGFNVGVTVRFKTIASNALKKATKSLDALGKSAKRSQGSLKGFRLALGLLAVGTLFRLGKGLVQTIGKLQLMFVRLSIVEGGAKNAKKSLDQLFKTFGAGPFSIDAVADSLIRLRSAGVEKELAFNLVKFGADAIAAFGGTSEELRRFSIGLQQVAGKASFRWKNCGSRLVKPCLLRCVSLLLRVVALYPKLFSLLREGRSPLVNSLSFFRLA